MPRFFIDKHDKNNDNNIIISGEDARHISRSLRMKTGEKLTVSDFSGTDYFCEITSITQDSVTLHILSEKPCESEPNVKVRIFQALPKGDKFDSVVQKCTELGVYDFTPVLSSRCISRPDKKSSDKKCERWQKISAEAAKQSGRGIIPSVNPVCDFSDALNILSECDLSLMCYECESDYSLGKCILENREKLSENSSIGIFIGPEGGISPDEAEKAKENGIICVGLGKRILRTETAPLFAVSAIMTLTGNAE